MGGSDNRDLIQHVTKSGTFTDDVLKVVFGADLRFEVQTLFLKAIPGFRDASISNGIVNRERNLIADL